MRPRLSPTALIGLFATVGWLVAAAPTLARQPAPPLEIYITNFYFDDSSNTYKVQVSVTDLGQVKTIEPRLLDLATGENTVFGRAIELNGSPVNFSLPGDQLKPSRKYRLALRAIKGNQYLRRQTQNANDDPLTFASQEFTYTPSQSAAVTFEIDGVNADFATHRLVIAIHHATTDKPLRYEAVIATKSGAAVGQIGPAELDSRARTIGGPLPPVMEQTDQPAEYHLVLRLFTTDNRLVGEQAKDFTVPPPPSPGIAQRVSNALATQPWLGWSMGGIAACIVLILGVRRFFPRRRGPLPRPHNLEPVIIVRAPRPQPASQAAPAAQPGGAIRHARAELAFQTPDGPGPRYALVDEATIGRASDNSIVLEDRYASRRQARIFRDGPRFILEPHVEASQPTRLNGRPISGPQVLSNGDEIEMGRTLVVFGHAGRG